MSCRRAFEHDLFRYLSQSEQWREVAWRCLECAPIWYRVTILEEPPFPLALLPEGYPMAELQRRWTAHLAGARDAIVRLWTELCA